MDWLEFRPFSRDVEQFCRAQLEHEASRHPRPADSRPDPRQQLERYGETCHVLLELSKEPPQDAPFPN